MNNEVDVLIPKVTKPIRVIFLFETSNSWYETTKEYKDEVIIPKFKEILREWNSNGSELIGTIDADVFSSGRASKLGWHACFLYDVPSFDIISEMTHSIREKEMDRYFRLEAVMGRKFFLLED